MIKPAALNWELLSYNWHKLVQFVELHFTRGLYHFYTRVTILVLEWQNPREKWSEKCRSIDRLTDRPTDWPANQPINQSINQLISQLVQQSTSQLINSLVEWTCITAKCFLSPELSFKNFIFIPKQLSSEQWSNRLSCCSNQPPAIHILMKASSGIRWRCKGNLHDWVYDPRIAIYCLAFYSVLGR